MWRTNRKNDASPEPSANPDGRLRDAIHQARLETAERSAVVVDLRDAEQARLELLNEALDPLFREIPAEVQLFDRGISQGDLPRLWIDVVAHVVMGRDKRQYRLVQDSRVGRKVLAESSDIPVMVEAITRYVARRLIEREHALSETAPDGGVLARDLRLVRRRRGWRMLRAFVFGLVMGCLALFAALWIVATKLPPA